ncbi:MAG TPA: PQQ-binding-like beta-propeller repeat protein [Solirubrobacterales bacterium]|nr:PQQ-binding-like beta-propeller repeat protein [Solirubrobacterales bacterium]
MGVGLVGLLILTIALAGCGSSSSETTQGESAKKPTAPPAPRSEYKTFQSSYADVDQQNTRDARSALKAANVGGLAEAWSRPIEGTGEGKGFVASPIVTDNIVFVQDLDSNVAALNLADGKPYWEKRFDVPALPPGGLTVTRGFQMVVGATPTEAFGLDERSGKEVWSVPLADPGSGTKVGMTPGYYNGLAYLATRPDSSDESASSVLWGLDVRSGAKRLRFEPNKWKAGIGAGLSVVPGFDFKGSVYMGAGAPGASSIFSLDETNGKLQWSQRLAGRSAGAWDPVVAKLGDRKFVVVADRAGSVIAFDRSGKVLWRHFNGSEVVGPIAVDEKTAYVPTGDGRQGFLVALNLTNGTARWKHGFQSSLSGPALVTNDVVFATAADGRVYALDTKNGKKLWSEKASSAIEGGLTVAGNTLLVRAGNSESNPGPELVAYRLGG